MRVKSEKIYTREKIQNVVPHYARVKRTVFFEYHLRDFSFKKCECVLPKRSSLRMGLLQLLRRT